MTKLVSREHFTDVKFLVEGKVICAHKILLSDRSEVFHKMFLWNANGLRRNDDPIRIEDVSYDIFNQFIDIIYYGTTPSDLEICLEMLTLAERYDIQGIKAAVESTIIGSINTENGISILINSYLNNANRLKTAALEFCARNDVSKMNGSNDLAKHPDLMIEVFKQYSSIYFK